jgi:acetylornithine deacetylase/succinyl-diaminopimelate desuccinylase-like protein
MPDSSPISRRSWQSRATLILLSLLSGSAPALAAAPASTAAPAPAAAPPVSSKSPTIPPPSNTPSPSTPATSKSGPTAATSKAPSPANDSSPLSDSAAKQLGRDIYRELVEINTSPSVGDTYVAAQAMARRLEAAGFPSADVHVFETAPKRGNLVARLRGTGKRKPILLLAHTDVVEAKREDWSTDPFKLVEKGGYFYARGSGDDKYMAATFILNLIRYRKEGYHPERDIIVALTTDEENGDREQRGIKWLIEKQRKLIDAEFALNEGGGVGMKEGRALWNSVQTSEKLYQSFWLTVKNSGGHSSQPRADNAIYSLAKGLSRLADYQFPVQLNPTTRLYFERMASMEQGQLAADMRAVLSPTPDPAAIERLSAKPPYNAQLRTTCVATQLEGGHAENALPQLARAMINCRILPGHAVEEIQKTLGSVLADPDIVISADKRDTPSAPSPLRPELLKKIEALSAELWPGIPIVPSMSAGATDSRFLRNAGIPAYGHSGLANDIFDVRAHGKDERVSVKAFTDGQEYLYRLVKVLSGAPAP